MSREGQHWAEGVDKTTQYQTQNSAVPAYHVASEATQHTAAKMKAPWMLGWFPCDGKNYLEDKYGQKGRSTRLPERG